MINKIKKINLNHSFIFFLFCNIVSIIIFKTNNFSASPIICLILILIIGVSHGSLDHIKGKKLLKILDINKMSFFYLAYILFVIFIIVAWVLIPTISLLVFLIFASYHFGKEDTQFLMEKNFITNQFLYFLKGSLVILAPMFFHFDETVTIYKFLLVEDESFYLTLDYIESNNILLIGIILSTLSSIFLFIKKFEIKKFAIFLDFFSINITEKIDNSYKIKRGIAKPICVIGSGGVNIAAAEKIITTTYFLRDFKYSESTMPTLASKLSTTGN